MSVTITVRHMDANKEIKDYTRKKADDIIYKFTRIEHVHIILDVEKHRNIAEIIVQAKNHIKVEAKEITDNMNVSIDGAVYKIEKQLRKLRDKVQDHKHIMKGSEERKNQGGIDKE